MVHSQSEFEENHMNHFIFKQMKNEDIPIYTNEIFSILANNMRVIAPTGNSFTEDYEIWLKSAVPVWREGKCSVILIFDVDILCGYFQYSFSDTTFKMEDIIKIFKLEKLIESSFKIKNEISKYYDEDPFKINNENLLREDVAPGFESGITDKE